jgi:hypothetical protein
MPWKILLILFYNRDVQFVADGNLFVLDATTDSVKPYALHCSSNVLTLEYPAKLAKLGENEPLNIVQT